MNRVIRGSRKERVMKVKEGVEPFDSAIEPESGANRSELILWLTGAILMFALLYGTSYLALFWLSPYEGVDMKSQLTADYSAWDFLVFEPVDSAIIEEVRRERGLPEQIIINGSSWVTPISTNASLANVEGQSTDLPAVVEHVLTSTPPVSSNGLSYSPTAFRPTLISTPQPTSVISHPDPAATSQSTRVANPTKSRKPPKTQKPPKTSKP